MANIDKLITEMSDKDLESLSKAVSAEEKARIVTESRAKKAISDIQDILDDSGFKLKDLFGNNVGPRIRDIPESRHINHPISRAKAIPRYKLDGELYDGRQARRAKEFSEFVRNGRVDVDLVVQKGALNPEWLDKQPERVLFSLGIDDLEKYKSKHGL